MERDDEFDEVALRVVQTFIPTDQLMVVCNDDPLADWDCNVAEHFVSHPDTTGRSVDRPYESNTPPQSPGPNEQRMVMAVASDVTMYLDSFADMTVPESTSSYRPSSPVLQQTIHRAEPTIFRPSSPDLIVFQAVE